MGCEASRPFAPMPEVGADSPHKQGVPAGQRRRPRLSIAVLELDLVANTMCCSTPQLIQDEAEREVEPHHGVGSVGDH